MKPTLLRAWMKKYGNWGGLLVASYFGLRYLWNRRLKVGGILAIVVLTVLLTTRYVRHADSEARSIVTPAITSVPVVPEKVTKRKAQESDDTPLEWQLPLGACAQMGVRDKYGVLGEYDAVFVVTAPDKEKSALKVHVVGSSSKEVIYPNDFSTSFDLEGKYAWVCLVQGKVVVHGAFNYRWLKHSGQQVTVLDDYRRR